MNSDHNSFIHDLQIASPCKMDWNKMTGDERKRFCQACKLHVYNISEMTLPEAEKLVSDNEGKVCVRMFRRADGTVITQDCPVGLAEKLKRRLQRSFAYGIAAVTLVVAWAMNWRVEGQSTLFERMQALMADQNAELGGAKVANPAACNGENPPNVKMGAPMVGSIAPLTTQEQDKLNKAQGAAAAEHAIMGRVSVKHSPTPTPAPQRPSDANDHPVEGQDGAVH